MKANIEKINIEGIPAFRIETEDATAVVSPYGAHVLSYTVGEDDLLWVSGKSNFVEGKAIRGGIPVCWPWFGSAASPAHGLARISMWNMEAPRDEADGSVTLTMTLEKNGLAAKMVINIGRALTLNLTTVNSSAEPVKLTEALHTYFNISDISCSRPVPFSGSSALKTAITSALWRKSRKSSPARSLLIGKRTGSTMPAVALP